MNLAGGLGKVKHLAIHEDVWVETKNGHGNMDRQFKRCSPMDIVQQLGAEHLTIVGKGGFFRDGNEFWDEVDERDWLWNSDTDIDGILKREEVLKRYADEQDSQEDSEEEPPIGGEMSHMSTPVIERHSTTNVTTPQVARSRPRPQHKADASHIDDVQEDSTNESEDENADEAEDDADVKSGSGNSTPKSNTPTSPKSSIASNKVEALGFWSNSEWKGTKSI